MSDFGDSVLRPVIINTNQIRGTISSLFNIIIITYGKEIQM